MLDDLLPKNYVSALLGGYDVKILPNGDVMLADTARSAFMSLGYELLWESVFGEDIDPYLFFAYDELNNS